MKKENIIAEEMEKEFIELLYLEFKMEWAGEKVTLQDYEKKREKFENLDKTLKNRIVEKVNKIISAEYNIDLNTLNSLK
ncbi:hypothetical protein [Fusobacterium sp.]|uniref:hypothetical protein n=1 Tax=Fusobacterium sp. TaxID=68766 RepID=UPI00396CF4FB